MNMKNITLHELMQLVQDELDRRNLKRPSIRKNALKHVCDYIQAYSELYHPQTLRLPEDKKRFMTSYRQYKGKELNDAEKSIINEIYNQFESVKETV